MPGWKAEAGSEEESVDSREPGLRFSLPPLPLLAGSSPCLPPARLQDPPACGAGGRDRAAARFWEVVAVEDGGLWVPVPALEVPRGRVSQAAVPCTHRSARAQQVPPSPRRWTT